MRACLQVESLPIEKSAGKPVFAGSINGQGSLIYEAEKIGKDTLLSQIIKLVEDAQQTKAPIAKIADQVSAVFVPVVMAIALISGLFWYFVMGQTFTFAMTIVVVSVLVIACPCAFGSCDTDSYHGWYRPWCRTLYSLQAWGCA